MYNILYDTKTTEKYRQGVISRLKKQNAYPDLDLNIIDYSDLLILERAHFGGVPMPKMEPLWKELPADSGEELNRFLPKPVVYISSPYTLGDLAANVRTHMEVANELIEEGFAPIAPLWSHFQHLVFPQHYNVWLELDKTLLTIADCVLRLPGKSTGANIEVAIAKARGIPVFYSLNEVIENYKNRIFIEEEDNVKA